jgi:hypothetical protein
MSNPQTHAGDAYQLRGELGEWLIENRNHARRGRVDADLWRRVEAALEKRDVDSYPRLWQEIQQPPPGPAAHNNRDGVADAQTIEVLAGPLSAADLARLLRQPTDRVESFLRRFRKDHPWCCEKMDNARRNEARILYHTAEVWPALQKQLQRRAWRKK